jgi:hypothetical protein
MTISLAPRTLVSHQTQNEHVPPFEASHYGKMKISATTTDHSSWWTLAMMVCYEHEFPRVTTSVSSSSNERYIVGSLYRQGCYEP